MASGAGPRSRPPLRGDTALVRTGGRGSTEAAARARVSIPKSIVTTRRRSVVASSEAGAGESNRAEAPFTAEKRPLRWALTAGGASHVSPNTETTVTILTPVHDMTHSSFHGARGFPVRSFSTSSPRQSRKRPMKPAYRASSMCRKTLTAEIQSGTSNLSTSDPSPLPYSLSEPRPAYRTQCFCPMEQSNMAKGAALPPFDCRRVSLKKTDAHRHDPGGGRDAPARCDRQTGHLRGHAARPVRGSDGDVGWKAWRRAISWAPAGKRRRCRRCTATWTCVTRAAIETVPGRGSCSASTCRERNCGDFRGLRAVLFPDVSGDPESKVPTKPGRDGGFASSHAGWPATGERA